MFDFTAKEIILMVLGSGGFIAGLISLFTSITGRLDKRRKRAKDELATQITQTTDMKRFELDETNSVHTELWAIIKKHKEDQECLERDLEECEQKAVLQRPVIRKIYANIRSMRQEIDAMNVLVMNEEDTNVFMRRFGELKKLLSETEEMLP